MGCSPSHQPDQPKDAGRLQHARPDIGPLAGVDKEHAVPPNSTTPRRDKTTNTSPFLHLDAHLMGTAFRLTIDETMAPARLVEAGRSAFQEIARIEQLMSEWQPTSEISRVNAQAGVQPVRISQETYQLLTQAKALSAKSAGAFDVTWAGMRGLWRFQPNAQTVPTPAQIERGLRTVGFRDLVLNSTGPTAFLKRKGMAIGLGAIAKGYGIDRAARILRSKGITRFMVDGGGDLFISGKKSSGTPWTIGVRHPRDATKLVAHISVTDGALVTSGDYERSFERKGIRYHHIIDMRTGYPAQRSVSVTVLAPTATLADALATAVFVLGPTAGRQLADEMPGVSAAIFAPDGTISVTRNWRSKFPKRWR
ncbi:MAG: FAD:protein FMN transferase [Myxococcota bacterium]|nr:FAD:protein FMN transferase [Myxococcota bacterium]